MVVFASEDVGIPFEDSTVLIVLVFPWSTVRSRDRVLGPYTPAPSSSRFVTIHCAFWKAKTESLNS